MLRDFEKEISDLENAKRVCERILADLRSSSYAGNYLEAALENINFLTFISRNTSAQIDELEQEAKAADVAKAPVAE